MSTTVQPTHTFTALKISFLRNVNDGGELALGLLKV